MSLTTLDQALFGERGFSTRLAQYIDGRGKLKGEALEEALRKTHQVKVSFRMPGDAKYEEVCKRAVKSGFNPHLVTEMVRDAIEEEFGSNPKGEVKLIVYPSGMSGSPPVRVFREVVSVALSADPEVNFLQTRLSEARSDNRDLMGHVTSIILGQQNLIGSQAAEIRKLATVRTASSAMADSGGGVIGLLTMAIGFPMMKRLMGLRRDATMEDVAERFGMLAQESLKSSATPQLQAKNDAEGGAGWDEADANAASDTPEEVDASEPKAIESPTDLELDSEEGITDNHIAVLLRLGQHLPDEAAKQTLIKRVLAFAHNNDIEVPEFLMKMGMS